MRATVRSLAIFLFCVLVTPGRAGSSENWDMERFLKAFLRAQPRFQAEGIFTSRKVGKPVVTCGARVRFDKDAGAVFSYNTTGEDLEPYDFYYWKRTLVLFVYDRERKEILKAETLGPPLRPVFNFVWEIIEEGERGGGFRTLLLSGLMRSEIDETNEHILVRFQRHVVPLPIREITYRFTKDFRFESFHLIESDGSTHSFQVKNYKSPGEKLRRPKIPKKFPSRR